MKTIILSASAAKDFDKLPADAQQQVSSALNAYAIAGEGDVKMLKGREGYRMRVGRYRIIFDEDQHTILAIYIGKRETTTYGRH